MPNDQSVDYSLPGAQLDALLKDESDTLANAAIFVALVFDALPDISWLGIYVMVVPLISDGRMLVVQQGTINGPLGVLDIDSPQLARFSNHDQQAVESLCEFFIKSPERKNGTALNLFDA